VFNDQKSEIRKEEIGVGGRYVRRSEGEKKTNLLTFSTSDFLRFNWAV